MMPVLLVTLAALALGAAAIIRAARAKPARPGCLWCEGLDGEAPCTCEHGCGAIGCGAYG